MDSSASLFRQFHFRFKEYLFLFCFCFFFIVYFFFLLLLLLLLLLFLLLIEISVFNVIRIDPDQTPRRAVSDLGLLCLPMSLYGTLDIWVNFLQRVLK